MGLSESRETVMPALPDSSAKYGIPTVRGIRVVNLTGAPVEFCQPSGSLDQTLVLRAEGEAPVLISDDIAMRSLIVAPDNTLANIGDQMHQDEDAVGFRVTTRRIIPRCIDGLPQPDAGKLFLLKPNLFYAAISMGRTDVVTMCGPVLLQDGRTAWRDLQEFVPRS